MRSTKLGMLLMPSAPNSLNPRPMLADRRARTDIKKVGELDNGLPIYGFKFRGSARIRFGVMADEVERVLPEAVTEVDGLKFIDLDLVGRDALENGA